MPKPKLHTYKVENAISTNQLAKQILKEEVYSLPFVVQSNFQLKGKGQFEKKWESEIDKNLLISLIIKAPKINIDQQFLISKAISIAIREVLAKDLDKVCIKWPNDIYVGNKKIAGILIENTIVGSSLETCIIGIGLNVNQVNFSKEIPNPTSYKLLTKKTFDIEKVKDNLIDIILERLKNLEVVNDIFEQYLYRKGELEQFRNKEGSLFFGVITGTNEKGQLLVRVEDHEIKTFSNNEIEFIQRSEELY